MTTAIAVFTQFYTGSTIHGSWQNFFVGKTVDGYEFTNFDTSNFLLNRTADEGGLTLRMPANMKHLEFIDKAISNEYLARVTLYEIGIADSMPTDLSNATVIAQFVGEVMGMQTDLVEITAEFGAAIDAVSGDIPGRKMSTNLIGRLPTL